MALIAALFLGFGLIARKLEHNSVTGPMVFTAGGLVCALVGAEGLNSGIDEGFLHGIAELTLILLLFGDAATISWSKVRSNRAPLRLLVIGLPLTIVVGTVVGWQLLPALGIWGAALLASILAPTDAALAQAMVTNESVPEKIRSALTVESGLNDGIALPVVLVTASCLALKGQGDLLPQLSLGAQQVLLGPPVGIAIGWLGAKATDLALKREWTQLSFEQFAGPALAVLAYAAAHPVGGNGFIAAFVAGLVFGNTSVLAKERLQEFVQEEGELLSYITFFLFGALLVLPSVEHWTVEAAVYALASLTVVRVVPVLLSLSGTSLRMPEKLLLGWFGPRGLASILFALLVIEESHLEHGEQVLAVVVITVLASVLLHGVSAAPLARRFRQ